MIAVSSVSYFFIWVPTSSAFGSMATISPTFLNALNRPTPSTKTCPTYEGSGTPLYCVPILLLNSQSSPTASDLQILLSINWSNYGTYLAANVKNVEFTDKKGNPLYAWCESDCGNSQTVSSVWVREDAKIAAFSQQKIYLWIFSKSTNEYNRQGYWGAYPTFTSTYGQYDNGPEVFNFYNNFNGTVLCSCLSALEWIAPGGSGGSASYSVSDGLTIQALGSPSEGYGYGYHIYLTNLESFSAVDSDVISSDAPANVSAESVFLYNGMDTSVPSACVDPACDGYNNAYTVQNWVCGCGNSFNIAAFESGTRSEAATGTVQAWTGVYSVIWSSTGTEYGNYNEAHELTATNSSLTYGKSFADISFVNGEPVAYYATFSWIRTRNAPLGDVMPSAGFGKILTYQ